MSVFTHPDLDLIIPQDESSGCLRAGRVPSTSPVTLLREDPSWEQLLACWPVLTQWGDQLSLAGQPASLRVGRNSLPLLIFLPLLPPSFLLMPGPCPGLQVGLPVLFLTLWVSSSSAMCSSGSSGEDV